MESQNKKDFAPEWDLKDLYLDLQDKRINQDLENLKKLAEKFNIKNQGQIELIFNNSIDDFFKMIKEYENIFELISKIEITEMILDELSECFSDKNQYYAFIKAIIGKVKSKI